MMEIILLVLGVIVFIISFLLPAGRKEETPDSARLNEEIIREMVDKEVDGAKSQINDIVGETVTYSMEKAERSMDRLTNEKMMAVNEYSDTVLAEINKNHKEVVFLYDMLNDKHENLKATVSEAAKRAGEVRQTLQDAEITAKEVQQAVNEMAKSAAKREEAEKASVPILEDAGFKPIEAETIEIPSAKPQKPKTPRKPRVSRPVKKAAGTGEGGSDAEPVKVIPENVIPPEVPEIVDALDEEDENGDRNNNEKILELHKAGKSNMMIARELGLGIGEVKLVIDLFEEM